MMPRSSSFVTFISLLGYAQSRRTGTNGQQKIGVETPIQEYPAHPAADSHELASEKSAVPQATLASALLECPCLGDVLKVFDKEQRKHMSDADAANSLLEVSEQARNWQNVSISDFLKVPGNLQSLMSDSDSDEADSLLQVENHQRRIIIFHEYDWFLKLLFFKPFHFVQL